MLPPKDIAKEWMRDAHDAGVLARKTTEIATLSEDTTLRNESQMRYLEDIQSHAKGKTLTRNLPTPPTAAYLNQTVYNNVMPKPKRKGLIYLDGTEVDLRTSNTSTKGSTSRARNNGLKPMPNNLAVTLLSDEESQTKVEPSKEVADDEAIVKIRRMKKKLGKYMHGTKRQKHLFEEEKEEKKAAIKGK